MPDRLTSVDVGFKHQTASRNNRFLLVLLYLFEFYLLGKIYTIYLAPTWGYIGFEFMPNTNKMLVANVAIACFVIFTPTRASVRAFYLNFLLSTHFVPAMVLFSYADKSSYAGAIFVGAYILVYVTSAIPISRFSVGNVQPANLMLVLAVVVLSVVLAYPLISGFGNFNLNIAAVYDFRREAADALPGIFGYISPIVAKIVTPVGLALALSRSHRRYDVVLLFMAAAILQFGFTSHKSVIFAPFAVVGVYYFLYYFKSNYTILILVIAGLVYGVFDAKMFLENGDFSIWGWYNSLIVRRVIMAPALLDYFYMDFFYDNPKYYWSSSKISLGLLEVPYDLNAPFVIGEAYFGTSETSANTGFIGSGYAQAGFLGVALYSAGIGLVIAFFQTCGRYLGLPFTIAATFIVGISFVATDFLILFVTHGLAALIFLLLLVCSSAEREVMPGRKTRNPAQLLSPKITASRK